MKSNRRPIAWLLAIGLISGTGLAFSVMSQPLRAPPNGDVFNNNTPGGLPSQETVGRDAQCGGTDRTDYDRIYGVRGVVVTMAQMGEAESRGEIIRCGACGQEAICWLNPSQGSPGVSPEGPYIGRSPPTGQVARRGPGAYPPSRVTCQTSRPPTAAEMAEMNRNPYWAPDCTKPGDEGSGPYGGPNDSATPQPAASKPAKLKYPWILGRPGWIAASGGDIRAYRFADGQVYEFPTTAPEGVLQSYPPPKVFRNGVLKQGVATYKALNGPRTVPGTYIE
jgi:hypothetical protein